MQTFDEKVQMLAKGLGIEIEGPAGLRPPSGNPAYMTRDAEYMSELENEIRRFLTDHGAVSAGLRLLTLYPVGRPVRI